MTDYPVLDLIQTKSSDGKIQVREAQLVEVPKVEIYDPTTGPYKDGLPLIQHRSEGLFAHRAFILSRRYRWVIGRDFPKESLILLVPFRE